MKRLVVSMIAAAMIAGLVMILAGSVWAADAPKPDPEKLQLEARALTAEMQVMQRDYAAKQARMMEISKAIKALDDEKAKAKKEEKKQ